MVRSFPEFMGIALVDCFVIMAAICVHIRTSWRGVGRDASAYTPIVKHIPGWIYFLGRFSFSNFMFDDAGF